MGQRLLTFYIILWYVRAVQHYFKIGFQKWFLWGGHLSNWIMWQYQSCLALLNLIKYSCIKISKGAVWYDSVDGGGTQRINASVSSLETVTDAPPSASFLISGVGWFEAVFFIGPGNPYQDSRTNSSFIFSPTLPHPHPHRCFLGLSSK